MIAELSRLEFHKAFQSCLTCSLQICTVTDVWLSAEPGLMVQPLHGHLDEKCTSQKTEESRSSDNTAVLRQLSSPAVWNDGSTTLCRAYIYCVS